MAVRRAARVGRGANESHRGGGESGKAKLVSGKRECAERRSASRSNPGSRPRPTVRGSQLFALVGDMQFELRSFKAHQHTAKLVPVDLATIDHEKRDAAATIIVPLNPATHYSLIRDLRSMGVVCEMFARQGAAHLFD